MKASSAPAATGLQVRPCAQLHLTFLSGLSGGSIVAVGEVSTFGLDAARLADVGDTIQ